MNIFKYPSQQSHTAKVVQKLQPNDMLAQKQNSNLVEQGLGKLGVLVRSGYRHDMFSILVSQQMLKLTS